MKCACFERAHSKKIDLLKKIESAFNLNIYYKVHSYNKYAQAVPNKNL